MAWKNFIQNNLDKLLLVAVFHGIMALLVSNLTNATLVDWLKGEAGTVLGALLILVTGRKDAGSADPPAPPEVK